MFVKVLGQILQSLVPKGGCPSLGVFRTRRLRNEADAHRRRQDQERSERDDDPSLPRGVESVAGDQETAETMREASAAGRYGRHAASGGGREFQQGASEHRGQRRMTLGQRRITCPLSRLVESSSSQASQWVEPVDRCDQASDERDEQITTHHMAGFVFEHRPAFQSRTGGPVGRRHDEGSAAGKPGEKRSFVGVRPKGDAMSISATLQNGIPFTLPCGGSRFGLSNAAIPPNIAPRGRPQRSQKADQPSKPKGGPREGGIRGGSWSRGACRGVGCCGEFRGARRIGASRQRGDHIERLESRLCGKSRVRDGYLPCNPSAEDSLQQYRSPCPAMHAPVTTPRHS